MSNKNNIKVFLNLIAVGVALMLIVKGIVVADRLSAPTKLQQFLSKY